MTLEELIYQRLITDSVLNDYLARYRGVPAVFYATMPDDKQSGWSGKVQYPRICYNLNFQVNTERSSIGTMELSVYCESSDIRVEEIEGEIRQRLKDVLLSPEDDFPYCFTWNSTEGFTYEKKIIGAVLHFDIIEYPPQESTDPDPILAMNRFIKELFSKYTVMGWDSIGAYADAREKPLFYCRLDNQERVEETNTVVWMNCRIAVHFLCPNSVIRLKAISALAQKISLEGEVIMLDGSPMTIQRLQQNNKADYLTEGQLYINCRYGILRYSHKPHQLTAANIKN